MSDFYEGESARSFILRAFNLLKCAQEQAATESPNSRLARKLGDLAKEAFELQRETMNYQLEKIREIEL